MNLLVIDGDNVFRRFWYANPEDSLSLWANLLRNYQMTINVPPCRLAIVWDGEDLRPGPEDYKANRKPAPEELLRVMLEAEQRGKNWGTTVKIDGPEGDQVVAGVAKWGVSVDAEAVYILSSDKDVLQLVDDKKRVSVIRPLHSGYTHFTEETVRKHFGFGPTLLPTFLALAGDASDNIKGVPGIGPKIATELIKRFGDIASIYESLDQITKPATRRALAEMGDSIIDVYNLVKLRYPPVPVEARKRNRLLG